MSLRMLPAQPLLDAIHLVVPEMAISDGQQAEFGTKRDVLVCMGLNPRTYCRMKSRGTIREDIAERVAHNLGRHILNIYDEEIWFSEEDYIYESEQMELF